MLGAILVVLVAFVYGPTLSNGFIWDDDQYVEENPTLQSLHGLHDIWFKLGAVPQYYPLVHTSFWIETHLWGLHPLGFHAVNLILHAISTVLVWRLLTQLAVPGAWLAAAIFGVHPVEVESVAWITERKNVLSCSLALGSFWPGSVSTIPIPTVRIRQRKEIGVFTCWRSRLYVAALLSKTVTVTLPAVILVIDWWKRGRLTGAMESVSLRFSRVGLSLASITVWMEKTHVGADGDDWNFSYVDRLLIAGRALWFYAEKLAWPYPLAFFYDKWSINSGVWWQYLYPAAALAVMGALWLARERIGRGPLAAVLIFAGVLSPALGFFNIYPFLFSFVADHFQYHASIALIAAAAAASAQLACRWDVQSTWLAPGVAAAVLVPLAATAPKKRSFTMM